MRPNTFAQIVGQRQVIEPLQILIAAARHSGKSLGHILFVGPPGLGKTTLARAIAAETGGRLVEVMGPKLDDRAALLNLLLGARDRDVIFIDEIHALRRETAESIYTAMEDFRAGLVIGEGERAEIVQRDLARFTMVGATTEAGRIPKPMLDRFSWIGELQYYSEGEIVEVLRRQKSAVTDDRALAMIANHAIGTPRRALRLLQHVMAFAGARETGEIGVGVVIAALRAFAVNPLGLSAVEVDILRALQHAGLGVPRGVAAIASQLNLSENVIVEVHEPVLLRLRLIARTGRGRMLTSAGQAYLEAL